MKIHALIGPSGTGKSYRAANLANDLGISYIIDDGLLIKGSKVVAGKSAKKEATRISSIRRALFMDPAHAADVKEAIVKLQPESILILGTSDSMVNKIVENLGLPGVDGITRIEDIATDEEITIARKNRVEQGKHVIPVPTLEIRKDFSGYFIDPLRIFKKVGKGKQHIETLEKTVVRPTFSYMGKFFISDSAIEAIATYNAKNTEGVYRVLKVRALSVTDGVVIYIDIVVYYGVRIHEVMTNIQEKVQEDVDRLTAINVLQVNVSTKGIVTQAEGGSV